MKHVLVILASGFEEIEAIAPIDILRRAKMDVTVAGVGGLEVVSSHGLIIHCDKTIEDCEKVWDCVVLPGGMPGAAHLAASWPVNQILISTAVTGNFIAAICASPAVVLGPAGLLENKMAVCYPGMEDAFPDFKFSKERLVVSENLITAKGPGVALDFGFKIVEELTGDKKIVEELKKSMIY